MCGASCPVQGCASRIWDILYPVWEMHVYHVHVHVYTYPVYGVWDPSHPVWGVAPLRGGSAATCGSAVPSGSEIPNLYLISRDILNPRARARRQLPGSLGQFGSPGYGSGGAWIHLLYGILGIWGSLGSPDGYPDARCTSHIRICVAYPCTLTTCTQ